MKKKIGSSKSMKKMKTGGVTKMQGGGYPDVPPNMMAAPSAPKPVPSAAKARFEQRKAQTPIRKGASSAPIFGINNAVKNAVLDDETGTMLKGFRMSEKGNIVPMKKGGSAGKSKMKMGGSLKDVPTDKVGLSKLPTAVRNKMGYKKMGGTSKMKMGGSMKSKKK
jgi:hypothetical protein